jgi:hypothetical protein
MSLGRKLSKSKVNYRKSERKDFNRRARRVRRREDRKASGGV